MDLSQLRTLDPITDSVADVTVMKSMEKETQATLVIVSDSPICEP